MSKYYLQWYRGATLQSSYTLHTPNSETNPWTWTAPYSTYSMNWESFAGACILNSDKLTSFPIDNLYLFDGTVYPTDGAMYQFFVSGGTENTLNLASLQVGDVIYIGKKREGSHLTVTGTSGRATFNYVCGDGTIAYQNVGVEYAYDPRFFRAFSIPWIGNIENVGTYELTSYNLARSSNYGYELDYQTITYAPTSTDAAAKFWGGAKPADEGNPYEEAGTTTTGGGDPHKQNFDDESDFVAPESLPDESVVGAQACDLVTIFSPSASELRNLASMLFSNDFFTYFVKEMTGISDLFISLGIVPFEITGKTEAMITFLEYASIVTPGVVGAVRMHKVNKQFYEFNMGTISMLNDSRIYASDSCLDYSPYSKLGIYLPFIGYQELDIDECRNQAITLKYRIDILSGSCIALISINGRVLYQFSGNCLTQIPITSTDASSVIGNAVNIGIAAASAGAAGAVASAGDAFTASRVTEGSLSAEGAELQYAQHAAQVANSEGSLSSATANAAMGMKPNFKKTGAVGASNSLLGVKQPYLVLTTPRLAVPEFYQKYCGLPCNITDKLGNFSGYTVVEDIRLNGLVALSPEVEEIYKLLKSGVIV